MKKFDHGFFSISKSAETGQAAAGALPFVKDGDNVYSTWAQIDAYLACQEREQGFVRPRAQKLLPE